MARTTTTRTSTLLAIGAVVAAVAVGVLVATTVGGPAGDNANGSVPVEDLGQLDGSWRAVNWTGAPKEVVGDVRLRFSDGTLVVETGCNDGRGTVAVEDSRLVAGPMMSTKMGCEPARTDQEAWLFAMVGATPRLELSGPYLSLSWQVDGTDHWLGLEQEDAPA
ncbi:META domain-containing protein [Oryzobacter sp. R7]|uniref:META domain-containing protein n=1 Tax=Oryzobacter faecalis TaxID=3388656 RepID=UPI00398D4999